MQSQGQDRRNGELLSVQIEVLHHVVLALQDKLLGMMVLLNRFYVAAEGGKTRTNASTPAPSPCTWSLNFKPDGVVLNSESSSSKNSDHQKNHVLIILVCILAILHQL